VAILIPFIWFVYFGPYHVTYIKGRSSKYRWAVFTITKPEEIIRKNVHYLIKWPDNRAVDAGLRPGEIIIKKTVCMPGELLEIKNTTINCEGVFVSTFTNKSEKDDSVYPPFPFPARSRIADDQFYVEGDTTHSYDSRNFGFVPRTAFWGTVLFGF